MQFRIAVLAASLLTAGAVQAQEIELKVELTGPLGTQTSHKGDRVFARVVTPGYSGDTVEGKVTDAESGGKLAGNSVLSFTFETWQHAGAAVPISSQVKSIANSKGQVDEEGRVVRKSNGVAKAAAGTAVGGLIGGIKGGLKGAAIGAGVGAVASIVLIEVAAQGPNVRFEPGSRVTLGVKARGDQPLPVAGAATTTAPAPAAPAPVAAAPAAAAAPAPAGSAQPNLTLVKGDFVPGEKTVFFDDFTDMTGDDAPPHWRVRGGSMALKAGGNVRQLTTSGQANKITLRPNLKGFPKNFTLESEVMHENAGDLRTIWHLHAKNTENDALWIWIKTHEKGLTIRVHLKSEALVDTQAPADLSQPVKENIWIQDGRLRIYINGNKAVDVNQLELPPIETADVDFEQCGDNAALGFRGVRIAESTPDFSQIIASSGTYVTHGILFDVDSDRIRPESAGVLKMIAAGLAKNPAMKVSIDGHTDSTGTADHNLDLHQRVRRLEAGGQQRHAAGTRAEPTGRVRPRGGVSPNQMRTWRVQFP